MKILVIDIGGSHVKVLASGQRTPTKLPSGPDLTPRKMVKLVLDATEGWNVDAISIGYPGPVERNRPVKDPVNLGRGWVRFDYKKAFGRPVRMVNDAAMQAIGSYEGGKMLFMGLGTGLGTCLIMDGAVVPLEVAHLPYDDGATYEEFLGEAGMDDLGKRRWRKHVMHVVDLFLAAFNADYVVLGGGNVRHMKELPKYVRRGGNENAFRGGFRLWKEERRRR